MLPSLTLKAYEYLAGLVAIVVIFGSLWLAGDWHGHKVVQAQWDAANAAQIAQDLHTVHASDIVTTKTITQFVDRYNLVLTAGATITREITHVITPEVDRSYLVPVGFIRVLNAAASGSPLDAVSPGRPDDAPSGITMSDTAGVIVDNYTTCRATGEQLDALQDWVTEQLKTVNKAKGP